MKINAVEELNVVIENLKKIDALAVNHGISNHFLEFVTKNNPHEFRINGNKEGLIYFAKTILEIAAKDQVGSHFHFDETGIVDNCDLPLIVCLKNPTQ